MSQARDRCSNNKCMIQRQIGFRVVGAVCFGIDPVVACSLTKTKYEETL